MKKTAALVLLACTLAACDTSVDPRPNTRPQALLMINGVSSSLNAPVNALYNGVVALRNAGEISADVASDLGTYLAEIKGDTTYYRAMTPTSALRNLSQFVALVNREYPSSISPCAQANLLRGAQFLIDAIDWSAANNGAVRPNDLTLPWGVCPWPEPVSNLTALNNGNTVDVRFFYAPNSNYFSIFQVMADGTLAQLRGEIDANDGVPGGESGPTGGVRSFTLPITPDPNLTILVRVCGGLHCADQTVAATSGLQSVPAAPATLTGHNAAGGVQLAWPVVPGADEYRLYRNGVLIGSLAAGITGYTDTSVLGSTTYSYEVESCNAAGCSTTRTSTSVTTGITIIPPIGDPACHVGGSNKDKLKCKNNGK
jgi:hypothetical protein